MSSDDLALLGGVPSIEQPLPAYQSIGQPEIDAVTRVAKSGCLSGFYGSWGDQFFGGPEVQALEREWSERFKVPYSVSVNSATSGLFAAIGAAGVSPGDEVIVPPTTMSATAMAPLVYGGIPVFADIEPDTFCLDPRQVERAITEKTRAIIVVNLFGQPAALHELRAIAARHDLILIEDNAQGPLATEHDVYAGTVGNIGVFSLNYHKHIHAGEGGICVTRDEGLYERLCMIRNHGENIVGPREVKDLVNLVGFNYRMTELSAAVARAQLDHIGSHVSARVELAKALSSVIQDIPGIDAPVVRPHCEHVYYVWAMRFRAGEFGCSRELFSRALAAEGFPHGVGYVPPLYRLPIFQARMAIGREGYPFTLSQRDYRKLSCAVAERLHAEELVIFEPCQFQCDASTIERLCGALHKVVSQRDQLCAMEQANAA